MRAWAVQIGGDARRPDGLPLGSRGKKEKQSKDEPTDYKTEVCTEFRCWHQSTRKILKKAMKEKKREKKRCLGFDAVTINRAQGGVLLIARAPVRIQRQPAKHVRLHNIQNQGVMPSFLTRHTSKLPSMTLKECRCRLLHFQLI